MNTQLISQVKFLRSLYGTEKTTRTTAGIVYVEKILPENLKYGFFTFWHFLKCEYHNIPDTREPDFYDKCIFQALSYFCNYRNYTFILNRSLIIIFGIMNNVIFEGYPEQIENWMIDEAQDTNPIFVFSVLEKLRPDLFPETKPTPQMSLF